MGARGPAGTAGADGGKVRFLSCSFEFIRLCPGQNQHGYIDCASRESPVLLEFQVVLDIRDLVACLVSVELPVAPESRERRYAPPTLTCITCKAFDPPSWVYSRLRSA